MEVYEKYLPTVGRNGMQSDAVDCVLVVVLRDGSDLVIGADYIRTDERRVRVFSKGQTVGVFNLENISGWYWRNVAVNKHATGAE